MYVAINCLIFINMQLHIYIICVCVDISCVQVILADKLTCSDLRTYVYIAAAQVFLTRYSFLQQAVVSYNMDARV